MKLTIEELRKVYEDAFYEVGQSAYSTKQSMYSDRHHKSLLAVARFVAERQRAVEPTNAMLESVGTMDGWDGIPEMADEDHRKWYRAMSAVAPLVVPEE